MNLIFLTSRLSSGESVMDGRWSKKYSKENTAECYTSNYFHKKRQTFEKPDNKAHKGVLGALYNMQIVFYIVV